MEHYFSSEPKAPSRPITIFARLRGKGYTFLSDRSVFSRGAVDAGTRLLIETVEVEDCRRALDWGCGYGAIGLVLADQFPHLEVTLIDINPRAVALAQANAQRWGLQNVRVLLSDGYAALQGEIFDAILSNPPVRAGKKVLWALIEGAKDHLGSGGSLWLVQRTRMGAKSTLRKMEEVFGAAETVDIQGGYRVLRAVRR